MGDDCDILIIGGGSAGATLAARLSERSGRRVILAEAGRDLTEGGAPAAVASAYPGRAYFDPGLIWPGVTVRTGQAFANDPASRPVMPYTQARVLGGGSAINGIGANRGSPADYDAWGAAGATGWTWANVLPFFIKAERDLDLAGPLHGASGPIPIRRPAVADRSAFARAFVGALAARGVVERPDQNGVWEDGVFALAANCDENWRRVSTADGYLTAGVRARSNLDIRAGAEATRLIFDGARAIGARLASRAGETVVRARETILCCGAIHTPTLLMRSGVGPAAHLAERGLAVAAHRPGVGANLMEHPSAGVAAFLPPSSRMSGPDRHHIPAIWRFSSGEPGEPQGDMHLAVITRAAWHGLGRRMGVAYVWVNRSHSRGTVRLAPDPARPPEVDLRLLSDDRDRRRLAQGFAAAAGLMTEVARAGAAGRPFPALMSNRARRFGAPSTRNALIAGLAGVGLDLLGPWAGRACEALAGPGETLADLVADAPALDAFLDRAATGVWHACGTCRMGRPDDPLAVTGPDGRVHGVEGLRICDASLFPVIPSANLNLPTIMVAERIAAMVV